MVTTDPRIDAYIVKSAPFARPILEHIRSLIHKACPDVEETIKWGHAFFLYKGEILCNMAAFKQHCAFGFWKASLMKDSEGILHIQDKNSMGHLDKIKTKKDLPADKILLACIREAARLNEEGVKKPVPAKKAPAKELPVPAELTAALKKTKKAQAAFEAFPPSHKREYVEWISEAKTTETKMKRVATTIEWLVEGKSRNWKYKK